MDEAIKSVVVTGPTACGKTALAVALARRFDGEIVSADSRQVYRGMDIGSGKDIAEYGEIPCHLIDMVAPDEEYHLKAFVADARKAIEDIASRGKIPVIAGGTALYLDALLNDYQLPGSAPDKARRELLRSKGLQELTILLKTRYPEQARHFKDWSNVNRLLRALEIAEDIEKGLSPEVGPWAEKLETLLIGVYFPREKVRARIEERLDARLECGMVEEVARLHDAGISWERLEFFGLEYRFIAQYLQGKITFDTMRGVLLDKIRQFAKRQDIFFRKMEREGAAIHWLAGGDVKEAVELVAAFITGEKLPEIKLRMADTFYGRKTD